MASGGMSAGKQSPKEQEIQTIQWSLEDALPDSKNIQVERGRTDRGQGVIIKNVTPPDLFGWQTRKLFQISTNNRTPVEVKPSLVQKAQEAYNVGMGVDELT